MVRSVIRCTSRGTTGFSDVHRRCIQHDKESTTKAYRTPRIKRTAAYTHASHPFVHLRKKPVGKGIRNKQTSKETYTIHDKEREENKKTHPASCFSLRPRPRNSSVVVQGVRASGRHSMEQRAIVENTVTFGTHAPLRSREPLLQHN